MTQNDEPTVRPRVIDLDSSNEEAAKDTPKSRPRALNMDDVELTNQVIDDMNKPLTPMPPSNKGIKWGSLFFSAFSGLLGLALGLMVDQLIRDLFNRHDWLGWLGTCLLALVALAALILIVREILALVRLRKIDHLRTLAETTYETNDRDQMVKVESALLALYANRIDLASARQTLETHDNDIMDPRERTGLLEQTLLQPLDKQAEELVMNAAKRVAIVTALAPRALIDVLYVLAENLRLIRALSALYGGKPGLIGFWHLTKNVMGHLAVTGAVSLADGLAQQMLGHGLAARLSARFGEGVLNGLLTARIGLAAHEICRPLPFMKTTKPNISTYLNSLIKLSPLQSKDQ